VDFLTTATDVDIKALNVRNSAIVTVVVPKENVTVGTLDNCREIALPPVTGPGSGGLTPG
jgi:hypothetical protein